MRYVSERGKIVPSRTAVSAKKQRELARAIALAVPRPSALT
jgi:ribosomal protein S18